MYYLGIMQPDEFMTKIVKALNSEVLKGDVYPLMAAYSENTCDRKYIDGSDYVCVNIKSGNEIFVVDIYPTDSKDNNYVDSVVLSLFRRKAPSSKDKWRKSLYKMTKGTENEKSARDTVVDDMIKKSSLHGFSRRNKGFKRMEKKVHVNQSDDLINVIVDEVVQIISAIRGKY